MRIWVKTEIGEPFACDVNVGATLQMLKQSIEDNACLEHFPVHSQMLRFEGQRLRCEQPLVEGYGFRDGCTVLLGFRPTGAQRQARRKAQRGPCEDSILYAQGLLPSCAARLEMVTQADAPSLRQIEKAKAVDQDYQDGNRDADPDMFERSCLEADDKNRLASARRKAQNPDDKFVDDEASHSDSDSSETECA
jgi:hypothetical protein